MRDSAPIAARFRVGICVLVAALLVVPAAVRAAGRLEGSSPSPVRLSRGFDVPPAKCSVAPPADAALPVMSPETETRRLAPFVQVGDEPAARPPANTSPDPQRGPPPSTLS